jgi:hypothetical protein
MGDSMVDLHQEKCGIGRYLLSRWPERGKWQMDLNPNLSREQKGESGQVDFPSMNNGQRGEIRRLDVNVRKDTPSH